MAFILPTRTTINGFRHGSPGSFLPQRKSNDPTLALSSYALLKPGENPKFERRAWGYIYGMTMPPYSLN